MRTGKNAKRKNRYKECLFGEKTGIERVTQRERFWRR